MYAPSIGRFLSRDPIGYDGSPYLLYAFIGDGVLSNADPTGNRDVDPFRIVVIRKKGGADLGKLSCGQEAKEDYDYTIEGGAPCAGYLIQEITVCCGKTDCKDCDCDINAAEQECKTYWESWYFRKNATTTETGKAGGWPATDRAAFQPPGKTCGRFVQHAVARFFCSNFKMNGNYVSDSVEIDWKNGVAVNPGGCGNISSGKLKSTTDRPWFWPEDSPFAPEGFPPVTSDNWVGGNFRGMRASWKCCSGEDDFFHANAGTGSLSSY
jgi:hypothetical protein